MVPDKFNMVDMGGIDLIMMQGEEVPGLYDRLVESITQCQYQCLYNWMFDGVVIPPSYVKMEVNENDEVEINEGVTVTPDDVIHIYSLDPGPVDPEIIPLLAKENGVYNVPAGKDGFNPVTVDVPSYTPVISPLTVTENGTYTPPSGTDGYSPVTVNIPAPVSTNYALYNMGFFGDPSGPTISSISVSINGHQGEYAIICVMHRDTLTPPSGCELLASPKSAYGDQWVSVYKCYLNSQSVTLAFVQNSNARMCATAWTINTDYSLDYSNTVAFQFYLNDAVIQTTGLTFVVFNSFYAQSSGVSYPVSDGAWICRANMDVMQYRHFSGVIPPTTSQKTTHIKQGTNVSPADTYGEIVVYSIIPE